VTAWHVFTHARHKLSVEAIWDLLRLRLLLLRLLMEQPRGMRTRGGRLRRRRHRRRGRGAGGRGGGVVINLEEGIESMDNGGLASRGTAELQLLMGVVNTLKDPLGTLRARCVAAAEPGPDSSVEGVGIADGANGLEDGGQIIDDKGNRL
jgi:hypothetical protein